ncbi:MAG TPA: DUF6702 family protein [Chitinophagaceae bacterium]|nr:DUF6702 family protein [Chitinophagaceae bacterium]
MVFVFHKWLLAGYMALVHPFFVSVTEIQHNPTDKIIEISCKTFTDDLEGAIEKTTKVKVDLINPKDQAEADKAVSDYIKKHFQVKIDGKPVQLEFVGFEREEAATWSYFQVSNVAAAPKKVDITTTVLFEASDKQINLLHVTVGNSRKSAKLDYPAENASFEFNR